ncbi:helix-turn-helix domain-containing protein [Bordetella avium]|uniref:Phage excisionase n=1 Tax=Bordetella avium (strain 197N) TaxID=360910 RepID=Q2L1N8_BORA1|nr:helix-turn-helix domain-containing protein [Bordetella avium]AZY48988.1 DNA-binding protein [Bordetella avium]AZY52350.1 DNA-binding protein [Bordetella avium]RIQ14232.1 DNA-binding protein [Bordetella avium]RIQ18107.1 DNA-binding protein [Bordetella avium]RIQ36580.1 DNA-binding protein [Bordetella avium]
MTREIISVEQAAQRLAVHPKTLLRYIREKRLKATRIGKSYRIAGDDLDTFLGKTPGPATPRVTSIVDLPGCTAEYAQALTQSLHARLAARAPGDDPVRVDSAWDPVRGELKLIVQASLADTAALLSGIQHLIYDRAPS